MNKQYTPSPWGDTPQEMTTALMSIPKKAELRSKLWEAQLDESKATSEYIDLADLAKELGMSDVYQTLHDISQDEHNHFMAISQILKDLED
jgi:rubrerythrin